MELTTLMQFLPTKKGRLPIAVAVALAFVFLPPVQSNGQMPPAGSDLGTYIDDWIQEDDGTVRQITRPAEGEKLTIGQRYQVMPYAQPNADLRQIYYCLVDATGRRKLLHISGWEWCGTSRRPLSERQQIPFDHYWDRTLIIPGKYKLIVTRDSFGQSSPNTSRGILAESKYFELLENPDSSQATGEIVGKIQISDSGLTAGNRKVFLDRIRIRLLAENELENVYLTPAEDGSFSAALPTGTYDLGVQSVGDYENKRTNRLTSMHLENNWLLLKQAPKEIVVKAGHKLTVNPILTHNENQTRPGWHYCDVKYSPP